MLKVSNCKTVVQYNVTHFVFTISSINKHTSKNICFKFPVGCVKNVLKKLSSCTCTPTWAMGAFFQGIFSSDSMPAWFPFLDRSWSSSFSLITHQLRCTSLSQLLPVQCRLVDHLLPPSVLPTQLFWPTCVASCFFPAPWLHTIIHISVFWDTFCVTFNATCVVPLIYFTQNQHTIW